MVCWCGAPYHQIHSLSSQQVKVWKEQPWHLLQLEHMSPLAHRPYLHTNIVPLDGPWCDVLCDQAHLPNLPPHISPGPFWQTVRPQESRVVS